MAHHFEYDSEHHILLVVLEGNLTREEILGYHKEVERTLGAYEFLFAITDTTAVVGGTLPGNLAFELSAYDVFAHRRIPRFIVAPQNHLYGVARMYELTSNASPTSLQVVRTEKRLSRPLESRILSSSR